MAKDENIHSGHRERLLETVHNVGLQGLSKVQAVEFILFYIFPRGDVNPLAHRLLDKFKNVSTIMDASVDDLMTVKGMGEISSKKLKALLDVFYLYTSSKAKHEDGLSTFGDIYDYAENLLRYKTEEELYVFGFNSMNDFVADRCLARGTLKMVGIEMREISNFVNTFKVPYISIAHNHPGGSCKASEQDVEAHVDLERKFEFAGCTLRDDFIIGEDGIYSMSNKCIVRYFNRNDKYEDIVDLLRDNRREGPQNSTGSVPSNRNKKLPPEF